MVILLAAIGWMSHFFVKRSMGEQLCTFSNNSFWLISVQLLGGMVLELGFLGHSCHWSSLTSCETPAVHVIGGLVRGSGHRLAAYPVMNSMATFDGQLLHRP